MRILHSVADESHHDLVQLTSASSGESYEFDRNGNRTTDGYTTGLNNQYIEDPEWVNGYDPEGNLVVRVNKATGQTWWYSYEINGDILLFPEAECHSAPDPMQPLLSNKMRNVPIYTFTPGPNIFSELS